MLERRMRKRKGNPTNTSYFTPKPAGTSPTTTRHPHLPLPSISSQEAAPSLQALDPNDDAEIFPTPPPMGRAM
jgi:hypothetical protein